MSGPLPCGERPSRHIRQWLTGARCAQPRSKGGGGRAGRAAAQPGRYGRPACCPRGRRTQRRAAACAGWSGAAPRSALCASAGTVGPCNQGEVLLLTSACDASSRQRAAQRHTVCRHLVTELCSDSQLNSAQNAAHLPWNAVHALRARGQVSTLQNLRQVPKARKLFVCQG